MGTIKADSIITMAVAEELRDIERKNKVETADYFHLGFYLYNASKKRMKRNSMPL